MGYITIRLDNEYIYLNDTLQLSYTDTNLPKEYFKLKTNKALYWKLELKQYQRESRLYTVEVLDYDAGVNESFHQQNSRDNVLKLDFEKLDWKKFEPQLFSYTLNKLKEILYNVHSMDDNNDDYLKRTAPNLFFSKREPISETIAVEKRVKFEEAKFGHQKISFSVRLKKPTLVKELEIKNDCLRPEFENIKPWFEKKIGKSFLAKINITITDNKLEEISVYSDDIDNITDNIIHAFRIQSVLNLKQLLKADYKSSYSLKEMLEDNCNKSIGAVSANDILEIFINNGKAKNVKQLEYLSRDKQSLQEALRFTLKPMFGFLFNTVYGEKEFCIWELLNSHATYIWKINKVNDVKDLLSIADEAITTIKTEGRELYKKYYRTLSNGTYEFHIIDHASINLTEEERFNQWKHKLERICK